MGAVNVVMGAVQTMMGVMDGLMEIMTWYERIGKPERVRVSLITVPDRRTAAGGHVIAGRAPLRRARVFPRWRGCMQGRCRGWRRRFPDLYAGHGAIARYSTTLSGWRFTLKIFSSRLVSAKKSR